jgi:hypothetical protein
MIGGAEPAPFQAIESRWNQAVEAGCDGASRAPN